MTEPLPEDVRGAIRRLAEAIARAHARLDHKQAEAEKAEAGKPDQPKENQP